MTATSGRFHHCNGVILPDPKPASAETVLLPGREVVLLQDTISLKAGDRGMIDGVIVWEGRSQALVSFSFRNGDTRFSIRPEQMLGVVELVPEEGG